MADKVHIIVNPFSARGRTGRRWNDIRDAIRSVFREFKFVFTDGPRQATTIVRSLLADGYDLIIGVGGDGTLNEIANGFFRHDGGAAINDDAALAIIPSGTGSDFIRFMKIPSDFRRSARQIRDARKRRIDVGRITFTPPGGPPRVHHFVNVADFGLGAEVIRRIGQLDPARRGPFTYYRGLLSTIFGFHAPRVDIVLDQGERLSGRYLIGAVANGPIFGGGMVIAPGARPDDGLLDLVLVEDMRPLQIIGASPRLYNGSIAAHPKVSIRRAKRIHVRADAQTRIEYDGELGDCLPAEFAVVERAVNLRF